MDNKNIDKVRPENIITKQIELWDGYGYGVLVPVTADEEDIKLIQDHIDKQKELLELFNLYKAYFDLGEDYMDYFYKNEGISSWDIRNQILCTRHKILEATNDPKLELERHDII